MTIPSLIEFGLSPFFQQQLSLDELEHYSLGRIVEQHRSEVIAISETGYVKLIFTANSDRICVGDWALFDKELRLYRVLERHSLFQRKAAGSKHQTQFIAANIDSVFIVCSLNQDFNLNRIERYLAITKEAQAEPIIILTKADLCDDVDEKRQQVQALDSLLLIHTVNALDNNDIDTLKVYCKQGKTLAFIGSSGVGKSTLVNGLIGEETMDTGVIREQDSKGRHTTTHRTIKWLPQGGLLMDTPGMRELQLSGGDEGVKETFNDIETLANQCRFKNCQHQQEPDCAIQKAIENGELDPRRLNNYNKLMREQAFNSATLAEKKSKERARSKIINAIQEESRALKR